MSNQIPLKPANERFTDTQWQSIFDKGDNLLVSASAGSGKTTVLVRRVIEKLKNGSNIDELLIVTFTEAAAREMKERIQEALQTAVNSETDPIKRQHFTKQLVLLPAANISTLHAFCLTVIRRFYYLIDLDPVFRMMTDETETILMKEDVWEELRETFYSENREAFFRLTENFSNDRSDEGLTNLVFSLYSFARANPAPAEWLDRLSENYQQETPIGESLLYQQYLRPAITEELVQCVTLYEKMVVLAQSDEDLKKIFDQVAEEKETIVQITDAFLQDRLEQGYSLLENLTFDRYKTYPRKRKEDLQEVSNEIKALRDQAKSAINDRIMKIYFQNSPQQMQELLGKAYPIVQEMTRVTQAFMDGFGARKREKGVLDFNDLEHLTLSILTTKEGNEWFPSEASDYYRAKFEEVMVDEYQDVNQLQEAILYWVRRPEKENGNLFMVGDVKQSIYSFRLADPSLFIEKYTAFEKEEGGRRIILAENFRSRSEVLDFTNLVFSQLMDPKVGQIEYDQAAELVVGFPDFPESPAFTPEILIYEKENEPTAEDLPETDWLEDKTDGELFMTGIKIRELIDQSFMIYDKKNKETRPIEYRDIVLLTPTKKNNLAILDSFKTMDIPLEVNDAQNYFQATEIRTMVSLLQIIDNPYQDIPLAAVLRSPLVGLSEVELAKIRLADRTHTFYEACLAYQTTEQDLLADRLVQMEEQLNVWREKARRESLADLLWDIYEKTAYLEYVVGLPAGRQRQANLFALIDRAKTYEASSFRGLYQFVRFIEKMQEKDKDLAEPLTLSEDNAVRVMTIHASKGLEFPVVFLLDTTKQFNLSDLNSSYIFEEKLGAGIKYLDPDTRVRYDTMPFQAIRQVRKLKLLSEEMRKLYVALTRAEQKLFLVGSYKSKEDTLDKWLKGAQQKETVLDRTLRLSGQSLLDWIGMSLARHPKMSTYSNESSGQTILADLPGNFDIHWWNQEQIVNRRQEIQLIMPAQSIDSQASTNYKTVVSDQLRHRLDFRYTYQSASKTTSYQSVSEIKRLFEDPDDTQTTKLIWDQNQKHAFNQTYRYTQDQLATPKFLQTTSNASSAAIGTATHYLLQLVPLTHEPTEQELHALIAELVEKRLIDPRVADSIDVSTIQWFFRSSLGQLLLAHPDRVKREQPFATLLPAEDVFADYPSQEDDLLIHGIIDGYIDLGEEVYLYDFKTDHLIDPTNKDERERVTKKYLGQLRLYRQALSEALGKPITKVELVLLSGKTIEDMTKRL